MGKYVVPRNKRRHLVVEDNVHLVVRMYAKERDLSLVAATYRLLKLGFNQDLGLKIADDEIDRYVVKKPLGFDWKSWFHRIKG